MPAILELQTSGQSSCVYSFSAEHFVHANGTYASLQCHAHLFQIRSLLGGGYAILSIISMVNSTVESAIWG